MMGLEDVEAMLTGLTIAGFDPSSGAGVTADLAVMAAHGVFGTSCITALTVQSTLGVRGWQAVDAGVVSETLDCLAEDLPAAGVKIGMLGRGKIVAAVASFLERRAVRVPVVLDPVLRSSSGRELLDADGVALLRDRLLPVVDWITPNMDELGILSGLRVETREEMEVAARALRERWPGLNVVATGGHLETPDDLVMQVDGSAEWLRGERIESRATHGTGCAFSTALMCGLAQGKSGLEAAKEAKEFVAQAIRRAEPMGGGKGPMNLLWPLKTLGRPTR